MDQAPVPSGITPLKKTFTRPLGKSAAPPLGKSAAPPPIVNSSSGRPKKSAAAATALQTSQQKSVTLKTSQQKNVTLQIL